MRAMANISMSYVPKGWKGWSFTLRGMNILDSNTRGVSTRAYDQEGVQIFYQDTDYYWYGPIAELSVSYNLNWQNQSKDKPDRSFGRDEF